MSSDLWKLEDLLIEIVQQQGEARQSLMQQAASIIIRLGYYPESRYMTPEITQELVEYISSEE